MYKTGQYYQIRGDRCLCLGKVRNRNHQHYGQVRFTLYKHGRRHEYRYVSGNSR